MTHGLRAFIGPVMKILLVAAVFAAAPDRIGAAPAAEPQTKPAPKRQAKPAANDQFEAGKFTPANEIDKLVLKTLREKKIRPANMCSDAVFIRRVHLDVIGTLPEPKRVRAFLLDRRPGKRGRLIDELMNRREFADYWSQRWGDLLRVKAEFPINLWPNAVQAYSRWIHDAVRGNMPYDRFARELLTSSGSNFRVPQVNFYRAIQGQNPPAIAAAAGLTFMGVRLDKWPKDRRAGTEAFFSRVAYKGTAEWKEQIVHLDPAPAGPLDAVFPDGGKVRIEAGKDPRAVFADWLITPKNKWFARNIVNRIWAWLLGRGIIHEPDDMRPDNPPVHPQVLAFLEKELVRSGYDLRHVLGLILNSATYQQSPIPRGDAAKAEVLFACYPARRLDAEVLIDALNWIAGSRESYSSVIPEPFTFIPEEERTIELEDGSITSQFLEMFGRPSRDTGMHSERSNKPSEAQRLHLLNSSTIQDKINRSWRLRVLLRLAGRNRRRLIDAVYVTILSRPPTPDERTAAGKYYEVKGMNARNASTDLAWALINTKEFLYRH